MTQEFSNDQSVNGPTGTRPPSAAAKAVAALIRSTSKAALATLDQASGAPYASLVLVAPAADGGLILMLSQLAVHTKNILADPRVSLLCEGAPELAVERAGDVLAAGRVGLMGHAAVTTAAADRAAFLAGHPSAQVYADFPDFHTYRVELTTAHFIGGFGRIVDVPALEIRAALRAAPASGATRLSS